MSSKKKKYEMTKQEKEKQLKQEIINNLVNESFESNGEVKPESFIDIFMSNIKDYIENMKTYKGKSKDIVKQKYTDYARQKQSDKVLIEQALNILDDYSVDDFFEIVDKCVTTYVDRTDTDGRPWNCESNPFNPQSFGQQYFDAYSKNFISQLTIAMDKKMDKKMDEKMDEKLEQNKGTKGGSKPEKIIEDLNKQVEFLKQTLQDKVKDFIKGGEFMTHLLSQPKVLKALKNAIKESVKPDKTPVVQGTSVNDGSTATTAAIMGAVIPEAQNLFDQKVVKDSVDSALTNNATIIATVEASVRESICNNTKLIQDLKGETIKKFDNKIEEIITKLFNSQKTPPVKTTGGQKTRKRKNKSIKNIYIK